MFPPELKFNQLAVNHTDAKIMITIFPKQKHNCCPLCKKYSHRIHSYYFRSLADLPISGKLVQLNLKSRKFFCCNTSCGRRIFTERYSSEIRPYARRLNRSIDLLCKVGLEVGGNKGAVISHIVGNPVSSSTMLRLIQQLEIEEQTTTSGIIGVDDWAYKKGRNYGTIIVDLDRRKVIDLLPDREADTLKQWLLKHPEVHTVSRDRASAYSKGIKDGAENAIQVADRFHLLVNLREAFQKVLYRHNAALKDTFKEFSRPKEPVIVIPEEKPVPKTLAGPITPNSQRQLKFEKAKELSQQGYGIKAISRMLQAHHRTIKKYLELEALPRRQAPSNQRFLTNFHSFRTYLLESYRDQDYQSLYANIRSKGFNGKYTQFCHNMNRFIKTEDIGAHPNLKFTPIETWSTSRISFMVLQQQDQLHKKDLNFLDCLYRKVPEIKAAAEMTIAFKNLFKVKAEETLKAWLVQALKPESELRSFAHGIQRDFNAVNQAVISSISNGQVEGQVNKLKNIKRMMYGRASFPLLRKMVLISSA